MRDDWKSITMESGELFVIITSTILMLAWSAIVSDTGSYYTVGHTKSAPSFSTTPCSIKKEPLIFDHNSRIFGELP